MERSREHLSETRPQAGGVARDVKRLKSDGAATVAELREFLGQMQGKSPQEVLGMVAKSGLTRSIGLATLLFVVLLVALTVIPYALDRRVAGASAPAADKGAAAKQEAAGPRESKPAEGPAGTPSAMRAGDSKVAQPKGDRALDALGIGETRVADPDKNPLEDKLDGLLDGVE